MSLVSPEARSEQQQTRPLLFWVAVVIIVGLGGVLRFSFADWDDGQQLHPDERSILFVAEDIHLPNRPGEFFRPQLSPLNPYSTPEGQVRPYSYGHFPLYVMVGSQSLLNIPCKLFSTRCATIPNDTFAGRLLNTTHQPRYIHLLYTSRALSALYDTITILVVGLFARDLFNQWTGILAMSMASVAVLHIQQSHFGTVDTAAALFSLSTIWLLYRYLRVGHRRLNAMSGICWGLAVGSKATAYLLILPVLFTFILISRNHLSDGWKQVKINLSDKVSFLLTISFAGAIFVLTNPYAILDPINYVGETITQSQMASGLLDWPFTRQYSGTLPIVYHVVQQARWTLGLPLAVVCYSGLIWFGIRSFLTKQRDNLMIMSWIVVMILTSIQHVKYVRYMLPFTTLFFIQASGFLMYIQARNPRLFVPVIAVVMLPTFAYTLAFMQMYRQPHPWITASEWIYQTIPYGSSLIGELWDDPLPMDIAFDSTVYLRERYYDTTLIDPFSSQGEISLIEDILIDVSHADYVILSSNRLYGVIPRMSSRYPYMTAYYQALFNGRLGFSAIESFSRDPMIFGVSIFNDTLSRPSLNTLIDDLYHNGWIWGYADESFTVYDHPRVFVFENREQYSANEMLAILLEEIE